MKAVKTMKMTKQILFAVIIIISIGIISCRVDNDLIDNNNAEIHVSDYVKNNYGILPSSVTSNIDIVIYDKKGKEIALIYGDKSEFVKDDAILQNMRVLFKSNGPSEEEKSTLISDYGKINLGKKIEAWGNVIMIKENEYRLETEKIIWEKEKKEISKTKKPTTPTTHDKEEEPSGGTLKTEEGKLVTIYYTDGTIIRGKNGYWEQGGNKIMLEETYTETYANNSSKSVFLSSSLDQQNTNTNNVKNDDNTQDMDVTKTLNNNNNTSRLDYGKETIIKNDPERQMKDYNVKLDKSKVIVDPIQNIKEKIGTNNLKSERITNIQKPQTTDNLGVLEKFHKDKDKDKKENENGDKNNTDNKIEEK